MPRKAAAEAVTEETKDLNEAALQKVEDKFNEQNEVEKEAENEAENKTASGGENETADIDELTAPPSVVPIGVEDEAENEVVAVERPVGRSLAAGTKLQFGGETITLAESVVVNYADEGNEQKFVGLCVNADAADQSANNLNANRKSLKFRYDGLGKRLDLTEQVEDEADLPAFVESLSKAEAASFGIEKKDK